MFSHKQDSDLNDIIEGFNMFSDEGGLINPNELKEIMETMNMDEKNPYIYNKILDLCSNPEIQEKGGIEAADFISLLDQGINDTSTSDGIHNIFSVFANTSTNTVPLQIFSQIASQDNSIEGGDDIKKIISKPEINGKELDFDEFHNIVKTETPKQSPNERPLYIKKSSSREGFSNNIKNKFNNKRNNDDFINNKEYNNINNMGSKNSSERNSSRYSYQNKRSPNIEENNNSNYKYVKALPKKSFPSNTNNNDMNNLDDDNQKDEGTMKRKVYRHNRGAKQDDEDENGNNYNEEKIENIRSIEENNSGEKSDRAERRYHRRYRETKPSHKK